MPISRDKFDEIDDNEEITAGTNAYEILSFLRENPGKAFTQKEIAENMEIKKGSIGPTLVRLREKGRVEHKGKYWRVSDHDRSLDHSVNLSDSVAQSHEDRQFEYEEWKEHSEDPREKCE